MRKGDRIETTYQGKVVPGVASSVTADKVTMRLDVGDQVLKGAHRLFRPSAIPLPAALAPHVKKGDRIETTHKGKVLLGVARSATATGVVMVLDGAKEELRGPHSTFRKSDVPLPSDPPGPMDRWAVISYKAHAGLSHETTAFSAKVTLDGKVVLFAENTGQGGCNHYHRTEDAPLGIHAMFTKAATDWAAAGGCRSIFEPDSFWLTWFVTEKPYGVATKALFEQWNRDTAPGNEAGGALTP